MNPNLSTVATLAAATLCFGTPLCAQQGDGTEVALRVAVVKPAKVPTSSGSLSQVKAPDGFTVSVFATGLKNSRILAVGTDGNVYVSRRDQGDVLLLKDANGDGRADGAPIPVAHRAGAHGIAVHRQKLYLVTVKELFVADIKADGTLGPLTMLLGDLPDSGQHPDGALLMADDANGTIYRIAYGSSRSAAAAHAMGKAPATAMKQQTSQGTGVALAKQREETKTTKTISITSDSFAGNAAMPLKHSEYADGVSPALSWKAVEGAKSYAIVLEDPDAKPITPFVHWLAWNIPAAVTSLPEGLQEQPRLTEPEGLLQGKTSRGSVGYFGPRPPAGDPPHHYHFQLFALDAELNVPAGADRDTLLAAMEGHVIASAEIVGTFQQTTKPLK